MKKVFLFLATGFEEVEALSPADILFRAGFDVKRVSITGEMVVKSSHGVGIEADSLFEQTNFEGGDMLILPGGMPGTNNLAAYKPLSDLIRKYKAEGKWLAAICAAPSVYGRMGLLSGQRATCYPGFENMLEGAEVSKDGVVVSGQFVTARGAGVSMEFGLKLLEVLTSRAEAESMAEKVIFPYSF